MDGTTARRGFSRVAMAATMLFALVVCVPGPTQAERLSLFGKGGRQSGGTGGVLGCVLPLSGNYKLLGHRALMGVLAATETLDGTGGTEVVVVDYEKASKDPMGSLRGLVREDHVPMIIGPILADSVLGLERTIKSLRVPTLVFPLSETEYAGNPYLIKFTYSLERQARVLAGFVTRDIELSSFAVIYPDTRPGRIMRDVFTYSVKLGGGAVVYEKTTKEFRDRYKEEIKWLQELQPEAVFIPDGAKYSAQLILKLQKEEGLEEAVFIGPNTWNSTTFYKSMGRDIDGIIFTDYFFPAGHRWTYFLNHFKGMYGTEPGFLEYQVYEAVTIVLNALNANGFRGGSSLFESIERGSNSSFYSVERDNRNGLMISPKPLILSLQNGEVVDLTSRGRDLP